MHGSYLKLQLVVAVLAVQDEDNRVLQYYAELLVFFKVSILFYAGKKTIN